MPRVPPRFDAASIGREVNNGRRKRGLTVVAIAKLWGIGRTHWYAKINATRPLDIEDIGLLAALLDAPKGWPIVPWDEGLDWEERLAEIQRRRDATAHR